MKMSQMDQTKLLRKYLKLKLICDDVTWRGSAGVRERAAELVRRTVQAGEAHSALLIGPRGCGKSTLISSVLAELEQQLPLSEDAVVVRLNGLIHHEEKLALQAITAQMQLENAVGDRVFGTVAENLSFLLSCLQSGAGRRCKSMLFLLDEFQAFCYGGTSQTLLYNLFDITHGERAPLCVLGITSRLDVMDLLEKRVKSRFSHRHIFIFPNEDEDTAVPNKTPCEYFLTRFVDLLSLPYTFGPKSETPVLYERNSKSDKRKRTISASSTPKSAPSTPKTAKKGSKTHKNRRSVHIDVEMSDSSNDSKHTDDTNRFALPQKVMERCKVDVKQFDELDRDFVEEWNTHVKALSEDPKVVDAIEKFTYYTVNEQIFRDMLLQFLSTSLWERGGLVTCVDNAVTPELRLRHLQSLSILELSLLIAMMHGMDVFDGQPMNFEMVLHRYTKFANANSSAQSVPRPVILKAFEHLRALELVCGVRGETGGIQAGSGGVQKEYQLYTLAVSAHDIHSAATLFRALPTEIMHWLNNSVV